MYSVWCELFILTISTFTSVLTFPTNVGIVGGSNTTIEQHPWLVSVWQERPDQLYYCMGFLVTDSWVVAPATCFTQNITYIRAGSNNYNSGGVISYIEEYVFHPDFDFGTYDCDIALIRLKTPVAGDNIRPLALPDKNVSIADGDALLIAGWGQTNAENIEYSDTLHEQQIPAVTFKACRKIYADFITKSMTCAGGIQNEGPCVGDQGSPVLWNGQPVGIMIYSYYCAQEGYPAIFTNLLNFVDWIKENLEQ